MLRFFRICGCLGFAHGRVRRRRAGFVGEAEVVLQRVDPPSGRGRRGDRIDSRCVRDGGARRLTVASAPLTGGPGRRPSPATPFPESSCSQDGIFGRHSCKGWAFARQIPRWQQTTRSIQVELGLECICVQCSPPWPPSRSEPRRSRLSPESGSR